MDAIIKYDVTDAAIAQMKKDYMALTIAGIDDKEGFDRVHEARMVVKGKRVEVDKKRKELNADALAWQKKVNSEAKRITGLLEPIETHLQTEESRIVDEKARIKAEEERKEQERIQVRIDQLSEYGCSLPFFDVAAMTDEQFEESLYHAHKSHEAKLEREAREEAERIAKEREEREKREAEQLALVAEKEKLDAIRKEQEAKEAAIKAEQERIEAERRKIEEEKRLEAAKKEAAERALKEEAERREREQAEIARKEALKPDKEKAISYFNKILEIETPKFNDKEISQIVEHALLDVEAILQEAIDMIEKL